MFSTPKCYVAANQLNHASPPTLWVLLSAVWPKPVNLVLADDDEDDRDMLKEVLHEIAPHVTVTPACNGQQLMTFLNNSSTVPDIIFLDLNMPLKNGQECLTEIRANKKFKAVPVFMQPQKDKFVISINHFK